LAEEETDIVLHGGDAGDAEGVHQYLGHIGAEESGQGGAQMDVLNAEIQQGQQHDDGLLLIPGDVVDDGQVVDVIQSKDFLEFQSDDGQRVGVIALTGVQNTGNAANVAEIQLVVLVFGAAGGEDHGVLGQRLGKLRVVGAVFGAA